MRQNPYLAFASELARLNAPAPWDILDNDPGVIFDANGDTVLMVYGPDGRAFQIASLIVCAVNTCAGLKATVAHDA